MTPKELLARIARLAVPGIEHTESFQRGKMGLLPRHLEKEQGFTEGDYRIRQVVVDPQTLAMAITVEVISTGKITCFREALT